MMEYRELLEKLVKDYDGIKDNPDYLFRPGFARDRAYQKLLDDIVAAARKMLESDERE